VSDHDITIAEQTSIRPEEATLREWAKAVADKLCEVYPNHLWAVAWQGGALVVKNLAISGFYGMVLEDARKHSLKYILLDSVMKAGELLERCGMKRGAWDGSPAEKLEGSDNRFFKPWSKLKH
jgi:hypothetical protein